MYLFNGLWLAVLGVLGAASLIIAKRPDAKQMIDKISPYQGWIGAISALWGVWGIIGSVLALGLLAHNAVLWITIVANAVLLFGLGLLLGVGVLKSFIKNPEANARMDQTIAKLAPYQGTMGLVAIGVGIWMVVASIILH